MRIELIEKLINGKREIEFEYKNKKYSVTYYNDKRKRYISFCEFYKQPLDVANSEELLNISIEGVSLEEILSELPDSSIDIY